jgi:hypothetical protein
VGILAVVSSYNRGTSTLVYRSESWWFLAVTTMALSVTTIVLALGLQFKASGVLVVVKVG